MLFIKRQVPVVASSLKFFENDLYQDESFRWIFTVDVILNLIFLRAILISRPDAYHVLDSTVRAGELGHDEAFFLTCFIKFFLSELAQLH